MSTVQLTKKWQPKPEKNLVESTPVKKGIKLYENLNGIQKTSKLSAMDLMGLSWVLVDDEFRF